jgi:5-oxoprolinase (ATP-hydrolysing) subunit A
MVPISPRRVRLNCDMGERGPDHPTDRELMRWIDIANIACGGHAGDEASVRAFLELAREHEVTVTAHLSYPDRENFGRKSMDISPSRLRTSLAEQHALLPEIRTVKFHGALYNESCRRDDLAAVLTDWLLRAGITAVVTMPDSALARTCTQAGITVLAEAFAERRYRLDTSTGSLSLVDRDRADASIHTVDEAVHQAEGIIRRGEVTALVDELSAGADMDGRSATGRTVSLQVETICIHSDSAIALPLVRELAGKRTQWEEGR